MPGRARARASRGRASGTLVAVLLSPFALFVAPALWPGPWSAHGPLHRSESAPLDRAQDEPAQEFDLPLGHTTPLPSSRPAEEALARGDEAWREAHQSQPPTESLKRRAVDAWQGALGVSHPGDGARFIRESGDLPRRSDGVSEAVLHRLWRHGATAEVLWRTRFAPGASAAFELARSASPEDAEALLARVEWEFPLTTHAARAAIALADLALEAGRPSAAGAWLARAERHLVATDPDTFEAAIGRRRRAQRTELERSSRGLDHTAPQPALRELPAGDAPPPPTAPRLAEHHRIIGLTRAANDPFGRGLPSGAAFLADGSVLVQSALALMLLTPGVEGANMEPTRGTVGKLLGTSRAVVRAAASAGGWTSLPATDGRLVALVVGRAERPRQFLDLDIPPMGNVLAVVRRGDERRPIEPVWTLKNGAVVYAPTPENANAIGPERLAPLGSGVPVPGWTSGIGWEFQPGPVLADGTVYALARGLGDPTSEEDHADEVRLFAMDALTAEVLWSREVTGERGLASDRRRGDAGAFAVTTAPLSIERRSGTLIVGTNVGLLAAYDVADGRLLWAVRNQRASAAADGWPGSRPALLVEDPVHSPAAPAVAWCTPFGSNYAYALPAGAIAPDVAASGASLFVEPPRPRGSALSLAAVLPGRSGLPGKSGEQASTLVLLGREGAYDAVLLDPADGPRIPATYLAPGESLTGAATLTERGHLLVAGSHDLIVADRARGFATGASAPLPSAGAGRGGLTLAFGDRILVVGRDTVWVFSRR